MCSGPRLCCHGTMMIGANASCYIVTCIIFVFYAIISTTFVAPVVSSTFTPYIAYSLGPLLCIFCVMTFSFPAWVDPGYMPKSVHPRLPQYSEETLATPGESSHADKKVPKEIMYHIAGANVPTVLCTTCNILRPPGTSHCNTCGRCVLYLDHHCPWIGTDVGFRNHFFFLLGIAGVSAYCLWVFIMSVTAIVQSISQFNTHFFSIIIPTILCLLGGMFGMIFGTSMSMSHCGMISMEITTRSKLKKTQTPADIIVQAFASREIEPDPNVYIVRDITDEEYNEVVQKITTLKSFRQKHKGWRRVKTARFMPSLFHLDPLEAEKLAWIWTIALSRDNF